MTEHGPKTALTVRCARCDSPIEPAELAPRVRCAHCGAWQPVEQRLLDELSRYRAQAGDEVRQARDERAVAAAWQRSTDQIRRGTKLGGYLRALGLLAGLPTVAAFVGIALIQHGTIPSERSFYVNYMVMAAAGVGIALYYAWYLARRRRASTAVTSAAVAQLRCPECGGEQELGPGAGLERCGHCGAALLPSAPVREQAIDALRAERRRAALEKHRAERAGYASLSRVGMGPVALIAFIGGSFLLMIGGGTLVFSWLTLTGAEPYSPALFGMWGATLALVAAITFAVRRVRDKQQRYRDALAALARAFGGRPLDGLPGAVGWLNANWAGPSDPYELLPGSYYAAAELNVGSFRVFVDVNPVAASQHHRAYASILVPCVVPGSVDTATARLRDEAGLAAIARRIEAAGFALEVSEAGLIARAEQDKLIELGRPEAVAGLGESIADLVRLAAAFDR